MLRNIARAAESSDSSGTIAAISEHAPASRLPEELRG